MQVRVVASAIDGAGFGLATRSTASLNWGALPSPVLLPFLGRQTEVGRASSTCVPSTCALALALALTATLVLAPTPCALHGRRAAPPPTHRLEQVGSPAEAGIMSRILHGSFDVVSFSRLNSEPGHRWVYNGIFLESVPHEGGAQAQPQLLGAAPAAAPAPAPAPSPSPSP